MPTAAENRNPPATAAKETGAPPAGQHRDHLGKHDAHDDSSYSTGDAQDHGFGEELQKNMRPSGADRHAQADFPGALGHRHQQDIHDADPANHERDRCNCGQQKRHDATAALGGLGDLAQVADGEVIDIARPDVVPPNEDVRDLADRRLDLGGIGRLHIDLVHVAGQSLLKVVRIGRRRIDPVERNLLLARRGDPKDLPLGGRERKHDQVVLIRAIGCLPLGSEHADNAQGRALDLDHRADRALVGSE